jgi:sigma-E factor negative regulatory protein RseA
LKRAKTKGGEPMSEQISALMDDQLDGPEYEGCMRRLKNEAELSDVWHTYHLIGDALRGHTCGALPHSFRERLEAEPIVFAPRRKSLIHTKRFALSAAASMAAVVFVAWVAMPLFHSQQNEMASAPPVQTASAQTQNVPTAQGLGEYLQAHQRFSPASAMQGAAVYVRTVSSEEDNP